MTQLFIIADDFTGALDAAIPFGQAGIPAVVFRGAEVPWSSLPEDTQVVSVNIASRHLPPEQAGQLCADAARDALAHGVPLLMKKTDSALRGNIGSELAALMYSGGGHPLYFLPAFPAAGRTTCDGIQYWNGVPVAETAYGRDPFNPVMTSEVAAVIARQSALPIQLLRPHDPIPAQTNTIYIADASEDADLVRFCTGLPDQSQPLLLAGCAVLAAALAETWSGKPSRHQRASIHHLLVVSGSLHPVSRSQIRSAANSGIPLYTLNPSDEDQSHLVTDVAEALRASPIVLVETTGNADVPGSPSDCSDRIAAAAAEILLHSGNDTALAVFGGDTLLSIASLYLQDGFHPESELASGIPVTRAERKDGVPITIVSKSGGFGAVDIVDQIADYFELRSTL